LPGLGKELLKREILPFFAQPVKDMLLCLGEDKCLQLEEIRLRCGQPLLLKVGDRDYTLDSRGRLSTDIFSGYVIGEEDIYRTIAAISDNSLYAFEEEIRRGFITVAGGHRVGLAGQVVLQGGVVKTLLAEKKTPEQIIESIYIRTVTRKPTPEETKQLMAQVTAVGEDAAQKQQVLNDIFWAVLNSKEFIFNH